MATTNAISIKISNALTLYQFILQTKSHTYQGECAGIFNMALFAVAKDRKNPHAYHRALAP